MQEIAERLGFDLVSLRLELFGRRRDSAQAGDGKRARRRASREIERGGATETGIPVEHAAMHGREAR